MTRQELLNHIADTYGITPDYPFEGDFTTAVCRHGDNRKWFAILMEIPRSRLGLAGEGTLNVVNLKISPEMLPSLLQERGVFPAYHMSKTHWVTVALGEEEIRADRDMAAFLVEVSFTLTHKKRKT